MKHLKLFEKVSAYEAFKSGSDFVLPNVSFVEETTNLFYNKMIVDTRVNVGDVAYWDGSKIKTIALTNYNESMGQAVGVVAIPSNFLPDGKARIVALNSNTTGKAWSPSNSTISNLIDYNRVPITNNSGELAETSNKTGYLPSDNLVGMGAQSFVDKLSYYASSNYFIPSPYLSNNSLNPEFFKEISNYKNALSDFNGKTNTDILFGLGTDYNDDNAATCAKNHIEGNINNIEWYLPACGELAILITRLNTVNNAISTLNGTTINDYIQLWTSSKCGSNKAFTISLDPISGGYKVTNVAVANGCKVYPFAMID